MAASDNAAASDLVMVDTGAPLQECLRRLQGQLARVELLAAQEASGCPVASPAAFFESLLQSYEGTSTTASHEAGKEPAEVEERVTALCRRVARKLRRLSEEQHMNLCLARSSLDDDDMDAVVSSLDGTATASQADVTAHKHHRAAQQQQPGLQQAESEQDDIFGWVTEPAAAVPVSTPSLAPVTHTATRSAASADVDAVLMRMAQELADVVEARYRHADHLDDVHQQLLQLRHDTDTLFSGEEDNERLRALLAYRPAHTIASEKERDVWQRAWQAVLPATSADPPTLKVGDAVEWIDMAVLAHVNAQRYAALQRRWDTVQKAYEGHVELLNRRLAQAALQFEEMERRA
ncbi:hypothetical protein ABB37_05468 [Leptomonas pyrrhocoris]|uniref:Uncharacterized protein n=1 Tax=Leptomonas pyrrhocoris TaxID=157538 RepID=A0A0M9G0I8_LEPPY|nr:hypothetical protein ABB37_05468 [Leptomonas pyrrhocoris]KPA79697.1 hypothetical protein ABB37_05468 [Leptomonas pyrrhocoris]|eukprot:XP_015658136.1 hypothetical protein ABB37_05468 [Leptomonas pyrrhocoris]